LLTLAGCTSSSSNTGSTGGAAAGGTSSAAGTGGTAAAGGAAAGGSSGAGTAPESCSNTSACGGNVVGTWSVSSTCLTLSGQLTLPAFFSPDCRTAGISGSLHVTGSFSANADGTYTDNTTTTGTEQLTLAAACLAFSGTNITCEKVAVPLQAVGYSSVTCQDAPGGGCSCSATVEQQGGLGFPSADPHTSGSFATANNTLTLDGSSAFGYCAATDKMTWTPQSQSPTVVGTVTFQPGGSTGAGG